eukprot:1155102-Pelagomonas_calceolata.AAC.1
MAVERQGFQKINMRQGTWLLGLPVSQERPLTIFTKVFRQGSFILRSLFIPSDQFDLLSCNRSSKSWFQGLQGLQGKKGLTQDV